jgi:hypothetical protein
MARALRIAVKAVAIYIAVSIVAILMAEMTLHPWRRPMRGGEKEKIARSYSIHVTELQPVARLANRVQSTTGNVLQARLVHRNLQTLSALRLRSTSRSASSKFQKGKADRILLAPVIA